MPKRKKSPTQPTTETTTQVQTETPPQVEVPAEAKPQTPQTPQLEIRKITHEEYLSFGNEKKESEYSRIAKTIIEEALKSDSPIVVKLPPTISARRVVPILSRIARDMWASGIKIDFKASYKNNEIAVRVIRK